MKKNGRGKKQEKKLDRTKNKKTGERAVGRQLRQSWRVAAFDLWFLHNPLFRSRREARQSHGCRNTNHLGCTVLSRGWYTLRKPNFCGERVKVRTESEQGGGERERKRRIKGIVSEGGPQLPVSGLIYNSYFIIIPREDLFNFSFL